MAIMSRYKKAEMVKIIATNLNEILKKGVTLEFDNIKVSEENVKISNNMINKIITEALANYYSDLKQHFKLTEHIKWDAEKAANSLTALLDRIKKINSEFETKNNIKKLLNN